MAHPGPHSEGRLKYRMLKHLNNWEVIVHGAVLCLCSERLYLEWYFSAGEQVDVESMVCKEDLRQIIWRQRCQWPSRIIKSISVQLRNTVSLSCQALECDKSLKGWKMSGIRTVWVRDQWGGILRYEVFTSFVDKDHGVTCSLLLGVLTQEIDPASWVTLSLSLFSRPLSTSTLSLFILPSSLSVSLPWILLQTSLWLGEVNWLLLYSTFHDTFWHTQSSSRFAFHSHTNGAAMQGAGLPTGINLGSVSCSRTLQHIARRSQGSNHQPCD